MTRECRLSGVRCPMIENEKVDHNFSCNLTCNKLWAIKKIILNKNYIYINEINENGNEMISKT